MTETSTLSPQDVAELRELLAQNPQWDPSPGSIARALLDAAPALLAVASQSLEREGEIRRLRDVALAARKMPRWTPKGGGAGTSHTFQIIAADTWALDSALTELDRALAQQPPAGEKK